MCSQIPFFFTLNLILGHLGGSKHLSWGKPCPSMTKWHWSQVSSSTMEDVISMFKMSYFQRDALADIFFYFKLNFGALTGFQKIWRKKIMMKALSIHDKMALLSGL